MKPRRKSYFMFSNFVGNLKLGWEGGVIFLDFRLDEL